MKKVLVLVFSDLKHDARVTRQVQWLAKSREVTVVCFDAHEIPHVTFVRIKQTPLSLTRKALLAVALLLRAYKVAYRLFHDYGYLKSVLTDAFDLIVANDIDTLPLAFSMKGRGKILFDAHEYAPRHFENDRVWKLFFQPFYVAMCNKYIPRVDAMLTVSEGLAREYERTFGVKPTIITNATGYHEIQPSEVAPERIRLVHHGIANESRRLELMLDMMEKLDDRFTLDLILMISPYASARTRHYIETFKARISTNPRVRLVPPVRSHEVVETINHYDMGIFLIPPVNFNYANTLPNKLFDFIQARLGIGIGPTPEMAAIVNRFGNGVVADNFQPDELARRLNALTPEEVVKFKTCSAIAATELNAEKNEALFNTVVQGLSRPDE